MHHADSTYAAINQTLEDYDLHRRLQWGLETYGDGLAFVTSFGPSGMVLLDHLLRLKSDLRVITVDTGFLFPETHALMDATLARYPSMRLDVQRSAITPDEQVRQFGANLWDSDPDTCCFVRKVVPLADALAPCTAWISGIRRDQTRYRANTPFVRWDKRHEMVKFAPVADWDETQIWEYIRAHNLPYNTLHDKGYPSVGCTHCTRAIQPGEDLRAGRWDGKPKSECGIHTDQPAASMVGEIVGG